MLLVRLSDVDMHVGRVVILNASSSPSASSSACPAESNCLLRVATMNGVEGEFGEGNRMGLRARLGKRQRLASGDLCRFNMIGNLGSILAGVNRTEEARSVLERFVHEARRSGLAAFEAIGLADRFGWFEFGEAEALLDWPIEDDALPGRRAALRTLMERVQGDD